MATYLITIGGKTSHEHTDLLSERVNSDNPDYGSSEKDSEHFFSESKSKFRIAVGSCDGADTITAFIMHVLRFNNFKSEYFILSSEKSGQACTINFKPHVLIINGNCSNEENGLPDKEVSYETYRSMVSAIVSGGTFIYSDGDEEAKKIAADCRSDIKNLPYKEHGWFTNKIGTFSVTVSRTERVYFSGEHKMQCLSAAKEACLAAGIGEDAFYNAISSFK